MLEEVGGVVLDMPTLNAAVLARAEALKVPFADAMTAPELRVHERLSIAGWLEAWTQQLDKIRPQLSLDDSFRWSIRR